MGNAVNVRKGKIGHGRAKRVHQGSFRNTINRLGFVDRDVIPSIASASIFFMRISPFTFCGFHRSLMKNYKAKNT